MIIVSFARPVNEHLNTYQKCTNEESNKHAFTSASTLMFV